MRKLLLKLEETKKQLDEGFTYRGYKNPIRFEVPLKLVIKGGD
jgi:hypothetical protein